MRTYNEKLASLTEKSVWVITKQTVNFDEAFKAAKLFAEIPNRKSTNIADYFSKNYLRYGLAEDNYRTLVIPQFFGLITKTPLYARGSKYGNETPTAVFDALNACEFGGERYNIIKSEQLIKLKIRAITDTAMNNEGWNILPLVFSFLVLKQL